MSNWWSNLTPYDEKYKTINTIGKGQYGEVRKAKNILTGEIVAVKEIKRESNDGFPFNTLREIEILQSIKHQNIVDLIEVFTDRNLLVYLVFDYAEYDLGTLLHQNSIYFKLSERHIKSYMRQLILGMYALHQSLIYHRDLKPQNILVKKSNIVNIADFGLAKQVFEQATRMKNMTPGLITLFYRPLEIFLQAPKYGLEVDIWSLGCIFYEMMTARVLFQSQNFRKDNSDKENENATVQQILTICGSPDKDWPEWRNLPNSKLYQSLKISNQGNLNDFLTRTLPPQYQAAKPLLLGMLHYNPKERWSLQRILTDPFLHNINNSLDPARLEPLPIPERNDDSSQSTRKKVQGLNPPPILPKSSQD